MKIYFTLKIAIKIQYWTFKSKLLYLQYMLTTDNEMYSFLILNCQSPKLPRRNIIISRTNENQQSSRKTVKNETSRCHVSIQFRFGWAARFLSVGQRLWPNPEPDGPTVTSPCKHGRGEANKSDLIGPRPSVFIGVTLRFDRDQSLLGASAASLSRVTKMLAGVVSCGSSLSEEREGE